MESRRSVVDSFVGADRRQLVERLLALWEECKRSKVAHLVVLEGHPGLGKTRIVQEFFARLAATQPEPRFWPARLEAPSDLMLATRGRVVPERFDSAPGAKPSFAWVGITCWQDEATGEPGRALIRTADSFTVINEPILTRLGRTGRITRWALSLGVLIVGAVAAALALLGIGGFWMAVVALVAAFLGLLGLREPLRGLWSEVQRAWRGRRGASIDLARWLQHSSEDARRKVDGFLRELAAVRLPAVVVVDDATWADEDTVDLVRALLSRAAAVLVVCTVRTDPFEMQYTDRIRLGGVARDFLSHTDRMPLQTMRDADLASIVQARAPKTDPIVGNALARRASGNPFLLGALLETPVVANTLVNEAYVIVKPDGFWSGIDLDYKGVFQRYWERLPVDIQRMLAVASIHGMFVQPRSVRIGYQTVFGDNPPPSLLIEQARDLHYWLAKVDAWLDKFADSALLETSVSRGVRSVISTEQQKAARIEMVRDLLLIRASPGSWGSISTDARRVLCQLHVGAAEDLLVARDDEAARSAVELSELMNAPHEAKTVVRLADEALSWTRVEELVDRARSVKAEGLLRAGRPPEAEAVLRDQLLYREATFGLSDPRTLKTRANLSEAVRRRGRYVDAIELYEGLLKDATRELGRDDPETLRIRRNLAATVRQSGDAKQAVERYRELIADQTRVLGASHADTLATRVNLAVALSEIPGQVGEAIELYEAVLVDETSAVGGDNPETLRTRANLAVALTRAKRFGEALDRYASLVADETRVLGPDHPQTLGTRANMVAAIADSGQLEEAINRYKDLLVDEVRVLGDDHDFTLTTRANIAEALLRADRPLEGLTLLRVLAIDYERVFGRDNRETYITRISLAKAMDLAGHLSEAIDEFTSLLTDTSKTLGNDDPLTQQVRDELIRALDQAGRSDEADEFK